ncbi:MAG: NTP transferase domain-containing protein [Planctomycetales bacterium]|nr:NTP transferase domain-containing protein [Planctomycetales bacterium]
MGSPSEAPVLLIMAAGAARRYGGLKQLAPVGPSGEAMMEYSIFDAVRAGFSKIVLVVRREFESAFRDTFVDRAIGKVDIEFVFQDLDTAVPPEKRPAERPKPWGTAHAVLCAQGEIQRPFAVINADDFYGPSALAAMGGFLAERCSADPMLGAMVGYQLANTLSENGTVSRGVCEVTPDGLLRNIVERHSIAPHGDHAQYETPEGDKAPLAADTVVSMNLWGYPAEVFTELDKRFQRFVAQQTEEVKEFEIPTVTRQMMEEGLIQVQVMKTDEQWCGMTYQEDLPIAQARLASLVEQGVYPRQLW